MATEETNLESLFRIIGYFEALADGNHKDSPIITKIHEALVAICDELKEQQQSLHALNDEVADLDADIQDCQKNVYELQAESSSADFDFDDTDYTT